MSDGSSDEDKSALGTQEFWKETYQVELNNFSDHGDYGVAWFGQKCSSKLVTYIKGCPLLERNDPIIELGSGNGLLLIKLAQEGFTNLSGVDYVEEAVDLAKSVARAELVPDVKFEVGNILDQNSCEALSSRYALVLDKGTYDAISLSPDKELKNKYPESVQQLLSPRGIFLICSCNFTKSELVEIFKKEFTLLDEISFPQYSFGGNTGSAVTALVFQLR